jgi:hypothetical protein
MEGIKRDNCLLKASAVKRARRKSLLVGDKERENKERGSKKKFYQESNGIRAN